MIKRYQDTHGGSLPGSLHTFGFGYSLDSGLLEELSTLGDGTYSFIPDAGMVGTIFVHATANLLSCMSTQCKFVVDVEGGTITEALIPTLAKGKRAIKKGQNPS